MLELLLPQNCPQKEQLLELKQMNTLHQVLDWGRNQNPQVVVDEVLALDEFSFDFLIPWRKGWYLVLSVT